ncbi:hypothetical protein QZH41_020229 [Actinostola sp. cb2023]|nr:hypothetical protein QZH41_020229 [Actinostola sp. cb2023]
MEAIVRWLVVYLICISCTFADEDLDKQAENLRAAQKDLRATRSKIDLEAYRSGFKIKRSHQVAAVKSIQHQIQNYEKQYEMVERVTDKIFSVMDESRTILTEAGYSPGDQFPFDKKLQEALAHVLENTALFGDILLRLPDITNQIYRKSKVNQLLIKWCISICNASEVYDKTGHKLLSLVAQELKLVPKDSNYVNPYKLEAKMDKDFENAKAEAIKKQSAKEKKKEKKKKKKGPRLSDEL